MAQALVWAKSLLWLWLSLTWQRIIAQESLVIRSFSGLLGQRIGRRLIDENQPVGRKTQRLCLCDQSVFQLLINGRISGQQPEVRPVRPGYQRILVVGLIQGKYDVSAIKRTEEGNFMVFKNLIRYC
jgi:hypothetical protein